VGNQVKPIKHLYLNAGQMKTGTTLLSRFLRREKKFSFTLEKEIHFWCHHYGPFQLLGDNQRLNAFKSFSQRIRPISANANEISKMASWYSRYLKNPDSLLWYCDLFEGMNRETWWCDFSNLTCLITKDRWSEIKGLVEILKVSYLARNPINRAWSHVKFHHKVKGDQKPLMDYSKPEMLEFIRGEDIWPQCEIANHLDNLLCGVGENLVEIFTFEELMENPNDVKRRLSRFLDKTEISGHWDTKVKVNAGPSVEIPDYFSEIFLSEFEAQRKKLSQINPELLKGWDGF